MLKRLKLILLLFICPVFLFAQEIIKNADGSISVISGTMIYLDSSGNLLDEIQFQDSLKTGKYAVILKQKQSSIENRLKKKKSLDNHPELQIGNVLPITGLVDLYQNKMSILFFKKKVLNGRILPLSLIVKNILKNSKFLISLSVSSLIKTA